MARAFNIDEVRAEFPILGRQVNGHPLSYLDSAASAQKPDAVIDAIAGQARTAYANVHRGLHTLANETTETYEGARETVRAFLNAPAVENIVFARGATEGINIVANGIADSINPGDEIVLSVMEHHSNIVPWHFLRERRGAVLRWIGITPEGELDMAALKAAIGPKTRMVALSHMSNVLGTINPVKQVIGLAHAVGAEVLLDGCQAAVHLDLDVQYLGCDYYVFSGHKLYGPTGIGVLYGAPGKLDPLRPWQGGGEMIDIVEQERITYGTAPHKFEAGTPPILEAIGLGAAISWFQSFDLAEIQAHEDQLYQKAVAGLHGINGLKIHGTSPSKGAVLAFSLDGAHPHDIAQLLDRYGVAVRAGHHCAQPLMQALDVSATARASFGLYNSIEDVERFIQALHKTRNMLI